MSHKKTLSKSNYISEGTPTRTALYRIIPSHQQDHWHQSIGQYQYHH